jgi:hypothetical protein
MKFLDDLASALRYQLPHTGRGMRWLKDELRARGVTVTITASSLRDFVRDAAAAAASGGPQSPGSYATRLGKEIAARAQFLHTWTMSDDAIDAADPNTARLASLARQHALPRGWLVAEPMVLEYTRRSPVYGRWALATR